MKKCGFVIRVSTDKQAMNEEGSLKNQLERLQAHVKYKIEACKEEWVEAERYILKGVSGKDSVGSKEFLRLFDDIQSGRINTVLCTSLDRICRSVRDFLSFFEYLNTHNVEFVCLKESYDTTSPQGKLLITFMMALAEFEREQTSERVKEATFTRARRGLWNGGQIMGYDLDADRKGYIIPNEKEVILVNFTYDTYLKQGSILSTAKVLNSNGYRTKEYTTRSERFRPAKEFCYSSVKQMLTNYSYIGKKEINKRKKPKDQTKLSENERYQIVDAVWEPIVDEENFWAVQNLMEKNCRTKHNQVKPVKHYYILNSGLLWCEKRGEEMEGRSGTGKLGKRYYYYLCKNKDCKFKVPADEIERVIIEQIKMLSSQDDIIANIIKGTNKRLQKELPQLKEQKKLLQGELDEIRCFADGIMNRWTEIAAEGSNLFLNDKLEELGKRRKEIEAGIESLELMIEEIERESVGRELVMLALNKFTDVYEHIQPHKQKDLVQHVLHKAVLSQNSIKIALYGRPPALEHFSPTITNPRFQTATRGTKHSSPLHL